MSCPIEFHSALPLEDNGTLHGFNTFFDIYTYSQQSTVIWPATYYVATKCYDCAINSLKLWVDIVQEPLEWLALELLPQSQPLRDTAYLT